MGRKLNQEVFKVIKTSFNTETKKLFYRIISGWDQIVDGQLIYQALPIKLTKAPKGYFLWVEVASSSMATSLFYQQNLIIEKINLFTGIDNIEKIKIKIIHEERKEDSVLSRPINNYIFPSHFKRIISEIEDKDLLTAFERIAKVFVPKT